MTEFCKDIIQGTCMQMCPPREIASREKQRRLHYFETVSFTSSAPNSNSFSQRDKLTADPRAVVKEFSRSAAGKGIDPSELRPAHVLQRTMKYLVEEIANQDGVYPWQMIYWFIFDRTRAIRQDLVVQRITGKPVVEIFEKTCRFHILSGYKLCESPIDAFDPKINNDHTSECLKRLLCFYDAENHSVYQVTRAEFEAYYLLDNLGSFEALGRVVSLHAEIKRNSVLRLAFEINLAVMLKNFVRFFRLVNMLPYLACCAVHKHFNKVRADSLAAINKAHFSRNASLPLTLLVEMLNFNDIQEAKDFCVHYGVEVTDTTVKLVKGDLNISQSMSARFSNIVDDKLTISASDLISGKGTIPSTIPAICRSNSDIENCSAVSQPMTAFASQDKPHWFGKGRGRGRGRKVVQ